MFKAKQLNSYLKYLTLTADDNHRIEWIGTKAQWDKAENEVKLIPIENEALEIIKNYPKYFGEI
jgi:hypothetical protein|tara:strand:+ start:1729 stop:1920 length:192 start_codon:yes stop_codon:yes gene_type:complete